MPNPWLSAMNSDLQTFLQDYDPATTPQYATSSALTPLSGAASNRDPAARVGIAMRLLDDGADARVVSKGGDSPVHALLAQPNPTPGDAEVLRRLLDGGADVNLPDSKHKAPLAILFNNYSATDEESAPLYDVLFARSDLDLDAPASKANTVAQLLAKTPEYKPDLQRRAREHRADAAR